MTEKGLSDNLEFHSSLMGEGEGGGEEESGYS
jgi:hypothetical protein